VKDVATLGFHAAAHLPRSNPPCKPPHDLATFCSSYGKLTGTVAPDQYNVNPVTSNAVHNGLVSSFKNVVQHQLQSSRFSSSSSYVSSMSGGIVYDAFPLLATALTPSPALSSSQIITSHNEIPVPAVQVSNQSEPSYSISSLMMVPNRGPLAQAPAAKQSAGAASKAFDVYEFRDEDDCEPAGVGVSLRQRVPSRSAAKSSLDSPRRPSVDSQPTCVSNLTNEHQSETDAGLMSSQQNIAMIFDMDSKSVRHISLPVKTEHPDCLPLKTVDSTSLCVSWPTSHLSLQNNAVPIACGKRSMPTNDVKRKQVKLDTNTSSYPALENVGTSSRLSEIPGLISTVRKMSEHDGSLMTFDRWHEKPGLLQPVNLTGEQESLSSSFRNVMYPGQKVDVSTGSHITNTSCSEMVKCKSYPSSTVPVCQFPAAPQSTRSPHMWLVSGKPATVVSDACNIRASKPMSVSGQSACMIYANPNYHGYGIRLQNSVSVKPQTISCQEERSKFESSWWHVPKTNYSSAFQSNNVRQDVVRNMSFEEHKKRDTTGENLQYDALSHALDLSCTHNNLQMYPSTSLIFHSQSFHPNLLSTATAIRNNASHVEQIFTDSHVPYLPLTQHLPSHHLQQQQQQQLALSVEKKDIIEEYKMMVTDDEEKLMNRLKCNSIEEVPRCYCRGLQHTVINHHLQFVLPMVT